VSQARGRLGLPCKLRAVLIIDKTLSEILDDEGDGLPPRLHPGCSSWPSRSRLAVLSLCLILGACASAPGAVQRDERQAIAMAMFQERCKRAGESISKTIHDVDGIYLLKLRPREINYGDQFKLDDPYGRDLSGTGYIESFLRGQYEATHVLNPSASSPSSPIGYHFVEAQDPREGRRYRYTGGVKVVGKKDVNAPGIQLHLRRDPNYDLNIYSFVLEKVPAPSGAPRYGVTYEDISTREERDHWIAGSSLKVIDVQSGEVLTERIGYMIDRAQGSRARGRSPWLLAAGNACPSFGHSSSQPYQAVRFVEKVLKPSK